MTGAARGNWMLAAGAAAGIALAAIGVANGSAPPTVPDGAAAVVNGRTISRADYERSLAAVAADRRDAALDAALRTRILERLIEEELLIQRGLELELAARDPRVRTALAGAVIDLVVARAASSSPPAPTEQQLRAFYDRAGPLFRREPRVTVDQLVFIGVDAERRAVDARHRLDDGADVRDVANLADAPPAPLPRTPLPPAKVHDYVGPTVARAIAELAPGAWSAPIRSGRGYQLVRVVERAPGELPPYEAVRDQVQAEYDRSRGDRRLREFLDQRRSAASVAIAEGLP